MSTIIIDGAGSGNFGLFGGSDPIISLGGNSGGEIIVLPPGFGQNGNSGSSGIPGLQGVMSRLSADASQGNLSGVMRDIEQLAQDLQNFAGNQLGNNQGTGSPNQPTPTSFGGGGGDPSGCGSSGCGSSGKTGNGSPQQMLEQLLQVFGQMMQAFAGLLNLMVQQQSNSSFLASSMGSSLLGGMFL